MLTAHPSCSMSLRALPLLVPSVMFYVACARVCVLRRRKLLDCDKLIIRTRTDNTLEVRSVHDNMTSLIMHGCMPAPHLTLSVPLLDGPPHMPCDECVCVCVCVCVLRCMCRGLQIRVYTCKQCPQQCPHAPLSHPHTQRTLTLCLCTTSVRCLCSVVHGCLCVRCLTPRNSRNGINGHVRMNACV